MKTACNFANFFSCLRILCAPLLLIDEPVCRAFVICLAAVSDFLDGYFARKKNEITKLGTLLDPIADKLFVGTALLLFFFQNDISFLGCMLFLLREWSLLLFYAWLKLTKTYETWQIRSFICGKLMTTCQFISLFLLGIHLQVPDILFLCMSIFGAGSFFELLWRHSLVA